jgi:predicted ester cyclase
MNIKLPKEMDMSEQENLRIVEKIFRTLNTRELGAMDDAYAANYKYEAPGAPGPLNIEQSRGYVEGFIKAFPDLHFELIDKVAQGDLVAVTWMSSGTHTGPLQTPTGDTLPPTNKKSSVPGSSIYRFKNGKITSSAVYWDMVTLLAQLGLMPGM